jgi:hypothetical protein
MNQPRIEYKVTEKQFEALLVIAFFFALERPYPETKK